MLSLAVASVIRDIPPGLLVSRRRHALEIAEEKERRAEARRRGGMGLVPREAGPSPAHSYPLTGGSAMPASVCRLIRSRTLRINPHLPQEIVEPHSQSRGGRDRHHHAADNHTRDRAGVRPMIDTRGREGDAQIALVAEEARRFIGEKLGRERVVDQWGHARWASIDHDAFLCDATSAPERHRRAAVGFHPSVSRLYARAVLGPGPSVSADHASSPCQNHCGSALIAAIGMLATPRPFVPDLT